MKHLTIGMLCLSLLYFSHLIPASAAELDLPTWKTNSGRSFQGAPVRSRYNKESNENDFVFRLEGGDEFSVPASDLDKDTRRKFADIIARRRQEEKKLQKQADEELRTRQKEQAKAIADQKAAEFLTKKFTLTDGGDPSPVFVPVLMRELGNSPRGVSEGGA